MSAAPDVRGQVDLRGARLSASGRPCRTRPMARSRRSISEGGQPCLAGVKACATSAVQVGRRVRWLALLVVLALAWVPVVHAAQEGLFRDDIAAFARYKRFTTFDPYFSKYSKRYFGVGFDWRYFKAQAVAESNLREDVRSPVGAVGVMQVMPRTFDEIQRKNPAITGSIDQPRWNIAAGIWYDRQHYLVWAADRSLVERLKFTFGSYNAGRSSILRAQQFALGEGLNETLWESVAGELQRVTGRRSQETVAYVTRILDIKQALR